VKKISERAALWGLFLEKILESVEESVMVTNGRGEIIFVNKKYRTLFNVSRRNMTGKNWIKNMIPDSSVKEASDIFRSIRKRKMLCKFTLPVILSKEKTKYMTWVSLPLKRKQATAYMFVGKSAKVSAKKGGIEYACARNDMRADYRGIIDALFAASMKCEPGTASHSSRVMIFSVALAKKLKLSKKKIKRLKVAALLHDFGKLAIDDNILLKKGKLTAEEYEQIKNHPYWGAEMVRLIYFLHDIVPIMANHHENYDGTGYPKGKRGGQIPIESKILSVADIYEALITDRPYRKGFSKEEAIAIVKGERGRKLDPKITDIFLKIIKQNKLEKEIF